MISDKEYKKKLSIKEIQAGMLRLGELAKKKKYKRKNWTPVKRYKRKSRVDEVMDSLK